MRSPLRPSNASARRKRGATRRCCLSSERRRRRPRVIRLVPTPVDYWVCTTYPRERAYRAWYLKQKPEQPLLECYEELARNFPEGLAALPQLPEELSAAVTAPGSVRV